MSVKVFRVKGKQPHARLYLPASLARVVPDNAQFEAELTDEGILYRFVGFEKPEPETVAPPWAQNGASDDA